MQHTASNSSPVNARADIHQQVTDTIIRQLEGGTIPWHRPWEGDDFQLKLPLNENSGKKYRGINIVLLWCASIDKNFSSANWATFKQWKEKNEIIRKGEKGSMIVYYDTFEKDVEGEIKKIPFLKTSVVFNKCQLQSYEAQPGVSSEDHAQQMDKISKVEDFINNTKATITHSGTKACYVPSKDCIYMPDRSKFISTDTYTATEGYYSTILHELSHWTGAKHRLAREGGKKFGDNGYATEELVAELSAAFLCAELAIPTLDKGDHAAYIDNWLKVLKDNKKCVLTAASEASKAVDYLHTFQPCQPE